MLKKLFKYECKATARVLLPVYAGAAALTVLTVLLALLQNALFPLDRPGWFRLVSVSAEVLTVLGLLALFLACIFVNAQRFYKLLGDQGYLMFPLPATTGQHMAARLLCSLVWTALSLGVLTALGGLLSLGDDESRALAFSLPSGAALLTGLYLVVLAALGMALGYLLLYLCMAIGSHWPQQRLLATVAAYFVLQFALQLVAGLGIVAFVSWLFPLLDGDPTALERLANAAAHPHYWALAVPVVLLLAADAAVWLITHRLIDRHLNLA